MRGIGIAGMLALASATPAVAQNYSARIARVLKQTPLIDGHNDWAESLREREGEGRWTLDLRQGLGSRPIPYNTDIARLRQGQVGRHEHRPELPADHALPQPRDVGVVGDRPAP